MAEFVHLKFNPGFPINNFVDYLWKVSYQDLKPQSVEKILPDGGVEVFVNLNYDRLGKEDDQVLLDQPWIKRAAFIGGLRTKATETKFPASLNLMGIRFKPHGFKSFFNIGLHELVDKTFSLDDVILIDQRGLVERLRNADTELEQFAILENLLISNFTYKKEEDVDKIVGQILSNHGNVRMEELYGYISNASKNFLRKFKDKTGTTPKKISDIYRFKRVINLAKNLDSKKADWQTILYQCGYYDQAHFIHDFKKYSGVTPSKYFKNKVDYFSHGDDKELFY